jgi:hypothetical protein
LQLMKMTTLVVVLAVALRPVVATNLDRNGYVEICRKLVGI